MKKAEKRKMENDFLKSYTEDLENLRISLKKLVESGAITKEEKQSKLHDFKLAKAKEAQALGIIPSHDLYAKWDSAFEDDVTVRLSDFIRLVEIRDLFELRELLGFEDEVSMGKKYFDKEFIRILVEHLGSEDAATGYLMAISRAIKYCEDEIAAEKILKSVLEKTKVPPMNEKRRERVVRSLNERLDKIYQK